MNIDWNNINDEFQILNKLIKQNIKQSETNINKLLSYDCVTDKDKFMKVLEKDTIEINKLYLILNMINFIYKDNKIKNAKKMVFCDTTLLVNKIWASFVFKEVPIKIIDLYQPQNYAIHLLCNIDLPWENDPLREHPLHREELLKLYENDLKQSNSNYALITGLANERFQNAIIAIGKLL